MPNKTHTTAVVLIPSEAVQPPIQAIRRIHDRNFKRWMPHITLLYPFAERRDFTEITSALAKASQQMSPFSIELARFDAFQHRKSCTMFLVPEPADEIARLHSTLLQHLPDYDDTAQFAVDSIHTSRSDNSRPVLSIPNSSDSKRNGSRYSVKSHTSVSSTVHLKQMTDSSLQNNFLFRQGINSENKNFPKPNRNFSHISFRV